jgi:hypothetical protein
MRIINIKNLINTNTAQEVKKKLFIENTRSD